MRIPVLLLMAGFGSTMPLAAQADPFAAYHRAIEERLVAMSDGRAPVRTAVAPERKITPAITVAEFALKFWGGRDADVSAAISRLQRYRPTVEHILEGEGVPKSLVAVVLVESGAQLLAASPKQARGLWQFIPATARQYGLTVTASLDERFQVEQSTRAAGHYLRDLYKRFGDWSLALAGYNAGAEAVQRALQRGHATTFPEISAARLLPEETRKYVPAVLSAIELLGAGGLVDPVESQLAVKQQGARILYAPVTIN